MIDFLREYFAPGPLFGWFCLAFLGLIPLVWIRALRPRTRPTLRFSSLTVIRTLRQSWATCTRWVIPLLRTSAIIAFVVALARPQSGGTYTSSHEGIAIQMVLDVSGSMAEQDFVLDNQPVRRLDAVKRVFEDFVLGRGGLSGRENDLLGMTTFAMYADTPCPLTLDYGSLVDLLRETEIPGWVQGRQVRAHEESDYTALGDAVVLATDHLRRAGEKTVARVQGVEAVKSKIMILLTDGADNPAPPAPGEPPAPDPLESVRIAARLGIKVYTIGAVGDARVLGQRRGFFFQPRAGVDEGLLRQIADVTGGRYFRATDTDSLVQIYEEIDELERVKTGEREYHDNIRAATLAMISGLGLLFTELLLTQTRYRRIP